MNILYHHRTRATDAQGVHIAELIDAFRKLGHSVDVAALVPPAPAHSAAPAGEPLWRRIARRVPFTFELLQAGYNLAGLWLLTRAILRRRPHFIYERYSLLNFSGVLAARLFRLPLILEVNSPLALETAEEGLLRLHWLGRWAEVLICNSASRVVVVTGVLRAMLLQAGVRPEKMTVLHNGVDPARFLPRPPDPALRRRLGLEGRSVIGFVGWFRAWHGLEMLLEAFSRSGLHSRLVSLLLVGDGPAAPALRHAARRWNLPVVFSGPVAHHQVADYIALFDCAVQPAANPYCCPMKIIEYLALAKPVIAPAQPNIEEIVTGGVEAALFRPGDVDSFAAALRSVFDDPARLAALTAGASSAIERRGFLWTRNAATVLSWITSAPSARSGPASTL